MFRVKISCLPYLECTLITFDNDSIKSLAQLGPIIESGMSLIGGQPHDRSERLRLESAAEFSYFCWGAGPKMLWGSAHACPERPIRDARGLFKRWDSTSVPVHSA